MTKPSRAGADAPGALPADTPGAQPERSGDLSLEGSTTIPELRMTFAQALEKWRELGQAERQADDQGGDAINLERGKLAAAILAARPVTPADALGLLELLADPETGLVATSEDPNDALAIQRAFAILTRAPARIVTDANSDAVLLAAYAEFDAHDRKCNFSGRRTDKQAVADYEKWTDLRRFLASTPARTPAGLAVLGLTVLRHDEDLMGNKDQLADWDGYSKPAGAHGVTVDEIPKWRLIWNIVESARGMQAARPQAQDPDAELIDTTARWFSMVDGLNSMEDDPTPEQWAEADRLHDRITALPARAAAGALAKVAALTSHMVGSVAGLEEGDQLYPLLQSIGTTEEAEPVAQFARRIAEHIREIDRDSLHAELTITALRTGKPRPGRDNFSATIAAFQGAAPAGLCIPDTPTDAMVQAGARAGGIDMEQARAIYAAMAGAYRQEAA